MCRDVVDTVIHNMLYLRWAGSSYKDVPICLGAEVTTICVDNQWCGALRDARSAGTLDNKDTASASSNWQTDLHGRVRVRLVTYAGHQGHM